MVHSSVFTDEKEKRVLTAEEKRKKQLEQKYYK